MQRSHPAPGLAIACLALLAGCASQGIRLASTSPQPHAFDGHWIVDVSRSEDPDASPGAGGSRQGGGMGRGHGHGGGGGMGGGGMGGRHGGGATGGSTGNRSDTSNGNGNGNGNGESMRRAFLLPDTLDIAMQPGALSITPDGHARTIPLVTGKATDDEATRAGWDGDSLVIVIHTDDKHEDIVQRYDITPDRSHLVVTTEFKRKSKTVSVVREFTPKPAPAA